MFKPFRIILADFRRKRDQALRERCVKYSGGKLAQAISLYRYIKDGTVRQYDSATRETTMHSTYP